MPKSQRIALHGEKWTESEEIPIKRSGIGPHGDVMATATRDSGLQRNVALPFGVVLALVGVIGFAGIPVTDGEIPGIFGIGPLHNVVHLLGLNRADDVLHPVLGIVLAAVDLGSSSAPTGAAAN